jgi:hypothetical protein
MPVLNTAIILWAWGTPVDLPGDHSWYEDYFFNFVDGQAGYWLKQSDGDVLISGRVFDWVFDATGQRDFSNRTAVAEMAIGHLEDSGGIDFSGFDCVVVVLGIPKAVPSNGGSAAAKSSDRTHHAIITRVRDPFDFVAHELGHAILGSAHSFTFDKTFQVSGEGPGGYGHRHCIMSAMVYGGNKQARHDAPGPRGLHREYQDIGPSLNGVTALARGWINAHEINFSDASNGEFEIRSRQWQGRNQTLPPQAIHLRKADGSTYVAEFYESMGWDQGLQNSQLIITQDKGGLADQNYPGAHSGTYLSSLALPASLTGPSAALNVPGPVGLIPLFYDPAGHVLKFRVSDSVVSGGVISITSSVSTQTQVVGAGRATFNPGERFCVTGEWTFDEVLNTQTITIEATHPRAHEGTRVDWTIDDVPCPPDKPSLALTKTVLVGDPKQLDLSATISVEVSYKIEKIPNGSRLILTNRPQDETFSLAAEATFRTSVAVGTTSHIVEFSGKDYQFPPSFWEQYSRCLSDYTRKQVEDSQAIVVFDPSHIPKVPPGLQDEALGWLTGLAHSLDVGDETGFSVAAAALRRRLVMPDAKLLTYSRRDALQIRPPTSPIAGPAAPEVEDDSVADGALYYVIEAGDTLSAIAKQFYGDPNKYPAIFEANREVIEDANLIFPGQRIRIPKA